SRRTATPFVEPQGSPKRASMSASRAASSGSVGIASTVGRPTSAFSSSGGRPPNFSLELIGGSLGDDVAVVDDPDAVGENVRLLEVLGRQEDGDLVLAREPGDLAPERGAALNC